MKAWKRSRACWQTLLTADLICRTAPAPAGSAVKRKEGDRGQRGRTGAGLSKWQTLLTADLMCPTAPAPAGGVGEEVGGERARGYSGEMGEGGEKGWGVNSRGAEMREGKGGQRGETRVGSSKWQMLLTADLICRTDPAPAGSAVKRKEGRGAGGGEGQAW